MMMLRSGVLIDPLNIDFSRVRIQDLAWALDGERRWGGHSDPRISVAQHTLACAREAIVLGMGARVALLALHHDDGEAFFKDMPRDLKHHPQMAWYREQEEECTKQCIEYFAPECHGLYLEQVKELDNGSLLTEFRDRFPLRRDAWEAPEGTPIHRFRFAERDDWRVWLRMHHQLRADCTITR